MPTKPEPRDEAASDEGRLTEAEFRAVAQILDAQVRAFESLPFPEVREQVFELLQTVDALHRSALIRLLDLLRKPDAAPLLERAVADPQVGTLFLLYDLVPEPPPPAVSAGTVSFIPFEKIGRAPARAPRTPRFTTLARLEDVPAGTMKGIETAGVRVLVANVAGEVYAVRDACPGSIAPLSLGSFTPPVIVCPWHNEAFDMRTGKRADGEEGPGLDVLPIAVRDGVIELAMTAATAAVAPKTPRP